MQDFASDFGPVTALSACDSVEHDVGFDGDAGAEVAQFLGHGLGRSANARGHGGAIRRRPRSLELPGREPFDLVGVPLRDVVAPLRHEGLADTKRPRDGGGAAEMLDDVGFTHGERQYRGGYSESTIGNAAGEVVTFRALLSALQASGELPAGEYEQVRKPLQRALRDLVASRCLRTSNVPKGYRIDQRSTP